MTISASISTENLPREIPTIVAIVPIHNGLPYVLNCLRSLYGQVSAKYRLDVSVVDDASTDGSAEKIIEKFPQARVLQGDGNLWWTGAIKLGCDAALQSGADYVLWINHDDILEIGSLERLFDRSQSLDKGIICASVIDTAKTQKALCGYGLTYWSWYLRPQLVSTVEARRPDFAKDCDLNGGHGILIPTEIFKLYPNILRPKVFPHYVGDFDFFYRAKKRGFKIQTAGGAVIRNESSVSGLLGGQGLQASRQILPYLTSRRSLGNLRDRPLFALLNFPFGLNILWAAFLFCASIAAALTFRWRKPRKIL